VYDCTASVALYEWDSTVTSVTGATQILNPYGLNGDERPPVALQTPMGPRFSRRRSALPPAASTCR
jgi:hypothetical protein